MKIYISHGSDENAAVSDICRRLGFLPLSDRSVFEKALPSASVSGGEISEYLRAVFSASGSREIFIPRIIRRFSMPAENPDGEEMTKNELSSIIWHNDIKAFYSPQMMINYFILRQTDERICFVLFDDARSISEKLRLARKLGFEGAILAYRSIYDIIGDIMF